MLLLISHHLNACLLHEKTFFRTVPGYIKKNVEGFYEERVI